MSHAGISDTAEKQVTIVCFHVSITHPPRSVKVQDLPSLHKCLRTPGSSGLGEAFAQPSENTGVDEPKGLMKVGT